MAFLDWLQFGLPLGSTLLIVAILDSVILVINMFKDFGIVIYGSYFSYLYLKLDTPEMVFLCTLPILKTIANIAFLWIGTIFLGNPNLLLCWIISTIICTLAITGNIIYESVLSVHAVYLYVLFTIIITYCYQIAIGIISFSALKNGQVLQPIGKGVVYIWEYFSNDLQTAAKFFLISEMVIDGYFLVTRQFLSDIFGVVLWGHEDSKYPAIVVEQLVMKCLRFVLNAIGLTLIIHEKRQLFRIWCLGMAMLILLSMSLFVIITVFWRGENLGSTIGLFLAFPLHLLYRCIVLYFCLRYTRITFHSMVL